MPHAVAARCGLFRTLFTHQVTLLSGTLTTPRVQHQDI